MRLIYSLVAALMLAAFAGGCNTEPKKIPCNDIDVPKRFEREIYVLKSPTLNAESEAKFKAARRLYQGVDFSFARDTKTLVDIFGTTDAHKGRSDDSDIIIFQYNWQKEYVRFAFMGSGTVITSCEVTMGTIK